MTDHKCQLCGTPFPELLLTHGTCEHCHYILTLANGDIKTLPKDL